MTKTICDWCGKVVDPTTCRFRIESLRVNVPTIDLCDDCQNKVKSFIFDQNKPTADKQTNLDWLKNRIQTMNTEEVAEMLYPSWLKGFLPVFCYGRNCSDYNYDCRTCVRAYLEEEHEVKEEKEWALKSSDQKQTSR